MVELTGVSFPLQPPPLVLHTGGGGCEFVVNFFHGHAIGKSACIENIEAVSKAEGRISRSGADRGLPIFRAECVGQIETRRDFLVALIIAECATRTELPGSG